MKYKLFSTNFKLSKQNGIRYLVTGLSLAPHGIGGNQVCESRTSGCTSACVLWFTGRTVTKSVRQAMIRRKELLFSDPRRFERLLREDIERHRKAAVSGRLIPAIRLNVASDLDWSRIAADYPDVRFYDYTKVRSRVRAEDWPAHYELTYSANERSHWRTITSTLASGRNVAEVFSTRYHPQSGRIDPLPSSWTIGRKEFPVVDGDIHDIRLRELDGSGVIVGLRFKGSLARRQEAIRKGFCINAE